jgi:hypothetical protein
VATAALLSTIGSSASCAEPEPITSAATIT